MKKPPTSRRPRKPYAPPRLVRYGNVAQLTQTRLRGRSRDNGKALKTRTR